MGVDLYIEKPKTGKEIISFVGGIGTLHATIVVTTGDGTVISLGISGFTSGVSLTAQTVTVTFDSRGLRAVVAVEGESDEAALATLAARRGAKLEDQGIRIVRIGGAHGIARFLGRAQPDKGTGGRSLRGFGACSSRPSR